MTQRTNYQQKFIEEKFEGMTRLIDAQFINVHDKLDVIEKHVKETNGKVATIEKETSVFRWASRHPVKAVLLIVFLVAGVVTLGIIFGFENIIKLI